MPRIAFHAPLKPPSHPIPSGDRKMARQLIEVLQRSDHEACVASEFRSFLGDPEDLVCRDRLLAEAEAERCRISGTWQRAGPPDLWLCYHPYYKSPDLIGPPLCRAFGVPWVTVEASLSARRDIGLWAEWQAHARAMVGDAAVNLALTARDAEGLAEIVPDAIIDRLPPFIDADPWRIHAPAPEPGHLVTVAMMRPGDKAESYRLLAAALGQTKMPGWRLTVIGDGSARPDIEMMFSGFHEGRVFFAGKMEEAAIANTLARATAFVWPGAGEAFGLSYLEAQAAGVPVVAMRTAGVPEVVAHGETGLLSEPGDPGALAQAIDRLLAEPRLARAMGAAGAERVLSRHSLNAAAARLDAILQRWVWSRDG